MVTVAAISLGEPSQDLAKDQARQQLHEHFELWLDTPGGENDRGNT